MHTTCAANLLWHANIMKRHVPPPHTQPHKLSHRQALAAMHVASVKDWISLLGRVGYQGLTRQRTTPKKEHSTVLAHIHTEQSLSTFKCFWRAEGTPGPCHCLVPNSAGPPPPPPGGRGRCDEWATPHTCMHAHGRGPDHRWPGQRPLHAKRMLMPQLAAPVPDRRQTAASGGAARGAVPLGSAGSACA